MRNFRTDLYTYTRVYLCNTYTHTREFFHLDRRQPAQLRRQYDDGDGSATHIPAYYTLKLQSSLYIRVAYSIYASRVWSASVIIAELSGDELTARDAAGAKEDATAGMILWIMRSESAEVVQAQYSDTHTKRLKDT